jgi:hypothetical protein
VVGNIAIPYLAAPIKDEPAGKYGAFAQTPRNRHQQVGFDFTKNGRAADNANCLVRTAAPNSVVNLNAQIRAVGPIQSIADCGRLGRPHVVGLRACSTQSQMPCATAK